MAAYVAGDKAAFQELYSRYSGLLYRVLRRGMHSQADAEDLLQQTFLQLHRARHDFKAGARLRPWLFTIALNLRREYYRRRGRRPEAPLDLGTEPSVRPALASRFEAARALSRALEQLEPGQREVIELFWLDQLSFPEVADVMGISLSAAKVRAHRGYQRLRAFLEDK